jgi:hypothetical protein
MSHTLLLMRSIDRNYADDSGRMASDARLYLLL